MHIMQELGNFYTGYCPCCKKDVPFHIFVEEYSLQLNNDNDMIITHPEIVGYCDICDAIITNINLQTINSIFFQQELEKLDMLP